MKTQDLLTSDEMKILGQALDAALDMQEILEKLVNGGMPYMAHLEKAKEQVAYLEKMHEMFGIERNQ